MVENVFMVCGNYESCERNFMNVYDVSVAFLSVTCKCMWYSCGDKNQYGRSTEP